MPELLPILFGGLASRNDDNLITLEEGLIVKDCILDTNAVQGRPGYRDVGVTLGGATVYLSETYPTARADLNLEAGWTKNPASTSTLLIGSLSGATSAPNLAVNGPGLDGFTSMYYNSVTPASADYVVRGTALVAMTIHGGSNCFMGIAGRMSTTAITGYVLYYEDDATLVASPLGQRWRLSKFVAGVETVLATYNKTYTNTNQVDVRLEMIGTSIKGYIDGVLQLSATDATITTAGKAGYYSKNTGAPGVGFILFAVQSAAVTGTTPQGIWRFRPTLSSVRTVVALGGAIFLITDPSSDTASDGTAVLLGIPFADTDLISGVQLGTNFYLGSNTSGTAMRRIKWTTTDTYTLESLEAIPQGTKPTGSLGGQLTWTVFSGITPTVSGCVLQTNANTGFTNMQSAWRGFSLTNNGNNDPAVGAYAQYKLAAAVDATANDWLLIAISPHDEGYSPSVGPKRSIEIDVAVDVAGSPGTFQQVGTIYDIPPVADSPNHIYCDLQQLDPSVRMAIRWIQFKVTGSSGGKFIVYGYIFLPGKPAEPPPFKYYVDFFDGSYTLPNLTAPSSIVSGQASPLTEKLEVNIGNASIASFPDSRIGNDSPKNNGTNDVPFVTTDLEFNLQAGKARPILQEIGNVVTITGTAPTFTSPASLTARLWQDLSNGRRLVAIDDLVTSAGAYTLVDNGGLQKLANQLYKAGGMLALGINALGSKGGRLIAGGVANKSHRQYISSFTPTSDTSNPFPQWPDIALEDADGWSFDLAPAPSEQIVAIDGEGDAVYTGTNLAVHSMGDLAPGTLPYMVFRRGLVSRRGFTFLEEFIAWAATDGIYFASNRSSGEELSRRIKKYYKDTFLPANSLCMGYDIESRSLIIIQGTQMLRYCFAAEKGREWSGPHTLAETVRHIASWIDPPGSARVTPQLWMLTTSRKIGRLQMAVSRDMQSGTDTTTGTKIPDWQYSTGFDKTPYPAVIKGLSIDADGVVQVRVAKTTDDDLDAATMRQTSAVPKEGQDEVFIEGFGDFRAEKFRFEFTAPNDVTLKRAEFEREMVNAKGG